MSLKVCTVGAGYFAQFHHDGWSRHEGVTLAAVCDADAEAARSTAAKYNVASTFTELESMLEAEKPQLLDIITPPPTHFGIISTAIERKVRCIMCQKPFCESLELAEQAVALAEAAGVVLVVHENFRWQPWHVQARRIIEQGALGQMYQVTFRLRPGDGKGPDAYLERQPYFQTMEKFLVHETAIHLIDVFRFLLAEEPSAVYAALRRLNPAIAGEDAGMMLFDFPSGARAVFDGNRLADHKAENRRLTMGEMVIEGSEGSLRLDGDGALWLRSHGSNDEVQQEFAWENRNFGGDCVYTCQGHVIAHLLSAAAGGGDGRSAAAAAAASSPLMNTAKEYLDLLRYERAVYESNESGARISLPPAAAGL